MKDADDIFGCIGYAASVTLILVIGTYISGWVLSILWGWFVSPIFNLPTLSLIEAIGISLVVGYTKSKVPQHDDNRKASDKLIESITNMLVTPLFHVGIGWIILQFM